MAKNKDKQREYQRKAAKKRYWANKTKVDAIKLEAGCCQCGYNEYACAMDFDHINPEDKSFNIGSYLQQYKWERLKEEIDKCRVMCANCHRIHSYETHYTRMGSDGTPSSSPITGTGT